MVADAQPHQLRILHVEDNPEWHTLVAEGLAPLRPSIATATTPHGAIARLEDGPVDLVLLDQTLPADAEHSQTEALDALLRQLGSDRVRCVFLTGKPAVDTARERRKCGALGHIQKGKYTPEHLRRVVVSLPRETGGATVVTNHRFIRKEYFDSLPASERLAIRGRVDQENAEWVGRCIAERSAAWIAVCGEAVVDWGGEGREIPPPLRELQGKAGDDYPVFLFYARATAMAATASGTHTPWRPGSHGPDDRYPWIEVTVGAPGWDLERLWADGTPCGGLPDSGSPVTLLDGSKLEEAPLWAYLDEPGTSAIGIGGGEVASYIYVVLVASRCVDGRPATACIAAWLPYVQERTDEPGDWGERRFYAPGVLFQPPQQVSVFCADAVVGRDFPRRARVAVLLDYANPHHGTELHLRSRQGSTPQSS